MFKKLSLFVVAVALMGSFAFAGDDFGGLDLKSISDANDVVVEAAVNVDLDAVANKVQGEDAIEACFHRCGWYGGCHSYGCYNYCYSPCYSYNYCYTPCYSSCYSYTAYEPCYTVSYRPVTYTTYSYCQPSCCYWGCY